jgi:hypothetical protein
MMKWSVATGVALVGMAGGEIRTTEARLTLPTTSYTTVVGMP